MSSARPARGKRRMSRDVKASTPVALRGLRVPATRRRWASVRGGKGLSAALVRALEMAWRIGGLVVWKLGRAVGQFFCFLRNGTSRELTTMQ